MKTPLRRAKGRTESGTMDADALIRSARLWLVVFVAGLVVSGLTALPLEWETSVLVRAVGPQTQAGAAWPALASWLARAHDALRECHGRHPLLAYGTDWLAFAHLVIAVAFWGAWRDPVRNVWVVDFGRIACALVIPMALACGALREIPPFWRFLDCSFGVLGLVPLGLCRRQIRRLEAIR